MNLKKGKILIILLIAFAGCGTPKVITSYRTIAEQAVAEGNYEAATENWRLFFEKEQMEEDEINPAYYSEAGKMAFRAHQADLAIKWFDQATNLNYSEPGMYLDMAEIYKQKNNLTKELEALKYYRAHYQDQPDIAGVNTRLFGIYASINQREKAIELWPEMSLENKQDENHLNAYFSMQKQLDNESEADSAAQALVAINPKHVEALKWLGTKYYHQAEDRYQREMKAYQKNKTHMQHLKLTQELKKVTAEFQQAAKYFKALWEIDQDPKYATYLVNIYTRFEDSKTADYYRKYLK